MLLAGGQEEVEAQKPPEELTETVAAAAAAALLLSLFTLLLAGSGITVRSVLVGREGRQLAVTSLAVWAAIHISTIQRMYWRMVAMAAAMVARVAVGELGVRETMELTAALDGQQLRPLQLLEVAADRLLANREGQYRLEISAVLVLLAARVRLPLPAAAMAEAVELAGHRMELLVLSQAAAAGERIEELV